MIIIGGCELLYSHKTKADQQTLIFYDLNKISRRRNQWSIVP